MATTYSKVSNVRSSLCRTRHIKHATTNIRCSIWRRQGDDLKKHLEKQNKDELDTVIAQRKMHLKAEFPEEHHDTIDTMTNDKLMRDFEITISSFKPPLTRTEKREMRDYVIYMIDTHRLDSYHLDMMVWLLNDRECL